MSRRRPSKARVTCRRCNELKERTKFVRDKKRPHGIFPWCKKCHTIKQQEYRRRVVNGNGSGERLCSWCQKDISGTHKNRRFCSVPCKDKASRTSYYGLEPQEYHELIASNKGKCPICLRNVRTRWNMDHNHITGITYGAVCTGCNVGVLAHIGHDPERAKRLVEFLEHPPVTAMFGERRFVGPGFTSNLHRRWLWEGDNDENNN